MKGARWYLFVVGLGTLLIGLVYVFAPSVMTDPMGFGELEPEAWTDIRATYGGLQVGLGAFAIWASAAASRYRPGLMFIAFALPAIAVSRAIGLLMDGKTTSILLAALVIEIALSVAAWVLLRRLERAPVAR